MTPQQADLTLTKTVNDPTPTVGDTITYTVTLSNNGPDRATNVQVQDQLPSGLSFVSATPSEGAYDFAIAQWNVGTVNVGSPETLVILARVNSTEPQTNSAMITHADQYDPDPTGTVDGIVVQPNAASAPSVTSLQRFGYHAQPTTFVLTFSAALDPARAQDPNNYTLRPIGPNGNVGKRIRIVSADYSAAAQTVTLHPATRVYLFAHYKLVVNGTAPLGLSSSTGVLLDGLGTGVPGSDYIRIFGPSILAGPNPHFTGTMCAIKPHSKSALTHSSIGEPRAPIRYRCGERPNTPRSNKSRSRQAKGGRR